VHNDLQDNASAYLLRRYYYIRDKRLDTHLEIILNIMILYYISPPLPREFFLYTYALRTYERINVFYA